MSWHCSAAAASLLVLRRRKLAPEAQGPRLTSLALHIFFRRRTVPGVGTSSAIDVGCGVRQIHSISERPTTMHMPYTFMNEEIEGGNRGPKWLCISYISSLLLHIDTELANDSYALPSYETRNSSVYIRTSSASTSNANVSKCCTISLHHDSLSYTYIQYIHIPTPT